MKRFRRPEALLWVTAVVDLVTTRVLVGTAHGQEANPVVRTILQTTGWWGVATAMMIGTFVILWCGSRIAADDGEFWAVRTLYAVGGIHALVVASNAVTLVINPPDSILATQITVFASAVSLVAAALWRHQRIIGMGQSVVHQIALPTQEARRTILAATLVTFSVIAPVYAASTITTVDATSSQTGDKILCDDFESGVADAKCDGIGGSWSLNNNHFVDSKYALNGTYSLSIPPESTYSSLAVDSNTYSSFSLAARSKNATSSWGRFWIMAESGSQNDWLRLKVQDDGDITNHDGSGDSSLGLKKLDNGTWYVFKIEPNYSANEYNLTVYDSNGAVYDSASGISFYSSASSMNNIDLQNNVGDTRTYVDSVYINGSISLGYSVSGAVTDSSGSGLADKTVTITDRDTGSTVTTATTDATGTWTASLGNGDYTASADPPQYTSDTQQFSVSGSDVTGVDLSLSQNSQWVENVTPKNGTYHANRNVNINATVYDAQGDAVTVSVYHTNNSGQFEKVYETTVQNGTNISYTPTDNVGRHAFYFELTDTITSTTTQTYYYRTPGKIRVFDPGGTLVTNQIDATINSIESGYSKSTTETDGVVDLKGAPDEHLGVDLKVTGYTNRSFDIRDPSDSYYTVVYKDGSTEEQQTYRQQFQLDDRTGDFPPDDTWLYVDTYRNGNWQLLTGDYFNSSNLAQVLLRDGKEYRLRVESDNGTRTVGRFIGDKDQKDQTVTIVIEGGASDSDGGAQLNQSQAPYVLNASPRSYRDDRTVQLNATVRDPEDSQSIDVTFYVTNASGQFEKAGTKTIASNDTATLTTTVPGGRNAWYVEMQDDQNATGFSTTYYFSTPGNLTIYNSSGILDSTTVTATFVSLDSNLRTVETTTDGNISLEGLPDERYRVEVGASGYLNRTIVVDDVTRDYQTLLYNGSETGVFNESFTLVDRSGQFPADETSLRVQDYINGQWQTIGGGLFGADNLVQTALKDGQSYRVVVVNQDGDRRELGQVIARDDNQIIEITVQKIGIGTGAEPDTGFYAAGSLVDDDQGTFVKFQFNDTDDETDRLTYRILRETDNGTVVLRPNQTIRGPLGSYGVLSPVSTVDETYIIQYWVVRNGQTTDGEIYVGGVRDVNLPVDPYWMALISFVGIIAMGGLVVVFNARLSAIVMFVMALGLSEFGLVPIPHWALAMAGATAILYQLADRGGINS